MRRARQYLEKLGERGELLIPLSLIVASGYLLYVAFGFRVALVMKTQGAGPDLFPKMYTIVMIILSLWLVIREVRKPSPSITEKTLNPHNLWIAIGLMVAYAFLLEIVGFVLITPIWIAGFMLAIGMRRWTWLVGTTIIFSAFMIVVFPTIMLVPLPRGIGIFRELSLLVY